MFGLFKKRSLPFDTYGIPTLTAAEERSMFGDDQGELLGNTDLPNAKLNAYDYITQMIIDKIDQDGLFWRKPWKGEYGIEPSNFISKKPYRGVNFWLLAYIFPSRIPYFMTFKQIQEKKGRLKKGATAARVIFFSTFYKDSKTGKPLKYEEAISKNGEGVDQLPTLKRYNVFRADDIEGIEWGIAPVPDISDLERIAQADAIIKGMPNPPKFRESREPRAYYTPDYVHMPFMGTFNTEQEYYSTYFHELVHSTGYYSRLNRPMQGRFGSSEYALEELIAELGASYLCGEAGILYFTLDNAAAYIKGWEKKIKQTLKENKKGFFQAAAHAQKSADYILNRLTKAESKKSEQDAKKVEEIEVITTQVKPNLRLAKAKAAALLLLQTQVS